MQLYEVSTSDTLITGKEYMISFNIILCDKVKANNIKIPPFVL